MSAWSAFPFAETPPRPQSLLRCRQLDLVAAAGDGRAPTTRQSLFANCRAADYVKGNQAIISEGPPISTIGEKAPNPAGLRIETRLNMT
jgi:hypothetical protein